MWNMRLNNSRNRILYLHFCILTMTIQATLLQAQATCRETVMSKSALSSLPPLDALEAESYTQTQVAQFQQLLQTRMQHIQAQHPQHKVHFMAFWDFDGTILDGDISYGSLRPDALVQRQPRKPGEFAGMFERVIRQGLLPDFTPNDEGVVQFFTKVLPQEPASHYYEAGLMANLPLERKVAIERLAAQTFGELEHKIFAFSRAILHFLREQGVEVYVLSASSQVFLREAADLLPLDRERITGLNLDLNENNQRIDPFFNFREGKRDRLFHLLKPKAEDHPQQKRFPLLAIGDSWASDGPMIRAVSDVGGFGVLVNSPCSRKAEFAHDNFHELAIR